MNLPTLPNINFLLRHPAHFFALGFGTGLAKKAPGTFGTLMGLPLFRLIFPLPELVQWFIIGTFFIVGVPLCGVTGQHLGAPDHGSIVWDEIVAMMLVLMFTPYTWIWWIAAFLLFRLFDIWKPFPIRQVDAKLKGGFGVMFDDILAAVYAIISLKIIMLVSTKV
ncbi:MAG: phosphatidylglycerophosphatase A [Methylophilaceae bacterium]|nr:phosphatidylglycerophosphatase A [Methylophilaceae bacterium]